MSPKVRATVDDSKWPRVYVTWPSEPLDDEAFEAAVLAMSELVKRGQPYVIIHDARRAVRPTPKQRAFAAEHQKKDAEPTRPQKTFSTFTAAEAWAESQLAEHRA